MQQPSQPDATDTRPSKIASSLTATVSALAIIGIFVQMYAYIIVRGFLEPYGVDPSEIDINPLNASLRLTFTTFLAVNALAIVSASLSLVLIYFIPTLRLLFRHIVKKPVGRLRRLVDIDRSVNKFYASPSRGRMQYAVASVIFFLLAGLYLNGRAEKAGFVALNNQPLPSDTVSMNIFTDLQPRGVVLEWRNPESIPTVMKDIRFGWPTKPGAQSADRSRLFPAQLIGRSGDRYVFYIQSHRMVVRVEGAAVNIVAPLGVAR